MPEIKYPGSGRWNNSFISIGHGGAGGLAIPNTLRSLQLALDLGVDMVEFDIRSCKDEIILLHEDDLSHMAGGNGIVSQLAFDEIKSQNFCKDDRVLTIGEAIDLIKGHALMNIDLKVTGCECTLLEIINQKGVLGDVLISSKSSTSLQMLRRYSNSVMTGISYPEDRGNASNRPVLKPIVAFALQLMKWFLPYHVIHMIQRAQANATMLHAKVVSRHAVEVIHSHHYKVFAWTIDELSFMKHIKSMGVNGIASNRPDYFSKVD
jgi:glycerophosphoryl diester phosphodiesterase